MLLSVPGKVLSRILLDRIKEEVDGLLRDEQAGFIRRGKSCTDQTAALRIILQQSLEWDASLYINFIDYEKAFDSVECGQIYTLETVEILWSTTKVSKYH